jgi:hypothetical protein
MDYYQHRAFLIVLLLWRTVIMTAPSSLVSAESHLLVPPQTQSFSYCHLPDVKATINCNKSSIMEVVSFLKYIYDPNVHISSCLQDCKLCWDANWCPVSVYGQLHLPIFYHFGMPNAVKILFAKTLLKP